MKSRLFVLFLIGAFVLVSNNLMAYSKKDIETLRRTNACSGCDLSRANLRGANLKGADLSGADLSYAKMQKSYLYMTNLSGANLRGALLEGALWIDGTATCKAGSVGQCITVEPAQ